MYQPLLGKRAAFGGELRRAWLVIFTGLLVTGCWTEVPYETSSSDGGDAPPAVSSDPSIANTSSAIAADPDQFAPNEFNPAKNGDIFAGLESVRRTKRANRHADVVPPPGFDDQSESASDPFVIPNDEAVTDDVQHEIFAPALKELPTTETGHEVRYPVKPGEAIITSESPESPDARDDRADNEDDGGAAQESNKAVLPEFGVDVPGDVNTDPHYAAWVLGIRLSRALFADDVPAWRESKSANLDIAQRAASALGLTPLEQSADDVSSELATSQPLSRAISLGRRVGGELASEHDDEVVALFELAFKSNLVQTDEARTSKLISAIQLALEASAVRAKLPNKVWRDALSQLSDEVPTSVAIEAVTSLQTAVTNYLPERPLGLSPNPDG